MIYNNDDDEQKRMNERRRKTKVSENKNNYFVFSCLSATTAKTFTFASVYVFNLLFVALLRRRLSDILESFPHVVCLSQ